MRSFQKLAGCFAVVLAACASTPPPTPTPQPAPEATPAPAPAPPAPREAPAAETRPMVAQVSIYFDFDSSTISVEGRLKMQSCYVVARRSDLVVRIEGNCDER